MNIKYYRVALQSQLPASSAQDGDLYFVRESGNFYLWDAANSSMRQIGGSAAVAWGAITGTLSNQTDLESALTDLANSISSEATARASADTVLGAAITSEASTRSSADTTLQTNITNEASTRASADTTNATAISTETSRATAAEALCEKTAHKDVGSGYAGLDSNSLLNPAELPPIFSCLLPFLPGLDITIVPLTQMGTVDGGTVIYTVPSGKRATLELWAITKGNATSTVKLKLQVSGGSQWIVQASTASPTANGNSVLVCRAFASTAGGCPLFEAGDAVAVTGSTGNEYVYGVVYVWNATPTGGSQLKNPKFSGSLLLGQNTIYTCPAGKKARQVSLTGETSEQIGQIFDNGSFNASGVVDGTFRVPSGATLDTCLHRLCSNAGTVGNSGANQATVGFGGLAAGDSIVTQLFGSLPFTITSVANASAGTTVYTGTITGGGANAFAGVSFFVYGFANPLNNGFYSCSASTATTITLSNSAGVAETHAARLVPQQFPISSVANASAGSTVYTGIFPLAGSNGLAGWKVTISGFSNSQNNGTWIISASSATTITVPNASGTAETKAASAILISIDGQQRDIRFVIEY